MANKECSHDRTKPVYEDHIFMGSIYYGRECVSCHKFIPAPPGPLELGTYR